MPDNEELIERIGDAIDDARTALHDFEQAQGEDSDERNADAILQATAALDACDHAIGAMVP